MANNTIQHKKLGDIGSVRMCKRVLKHQTSIDAKIPFYKISTFGGKADTFISEDLYNELKKKYSYPKVGDILISAAGTVGKTVIFNGEPSYFQDSNIVWIEHDESVATNKYLYYFYKTEPWRTTNGSTISRIYNDNLRDITIPTPSLSDQQKIAGVLSALDDKIELNRKINAELEQMARTLYDYWFVQFDFPDANGKPYKSSGGAMKFSPELNREIPQGWSAVKAGDALDIQLGGTPSRKVPAYWNQGMIPWLSSGEVANFPIINSVEYITESGVLNSAAKVLPSGSIMISITGNIRVSVLAIDAAANQSVVGVIPKDLLSTPYLYSYFQQLIPEYEAKMTGAVQKHINKEAVESTYVLRPEDNILLRYNDLINPIFAKIIANRQQSQNLAHLRDWLLPMLMNGQVSVE